MRFLRALLELFAEEQVEHVGLLRRRHRELEERCHRIFLVGEPRGDVQARGSGEAHQAALLLRPSASDALGVVTRVREATLFQGPEAEMMSTIVSGIAHEVHRFRTECFTSPSSLDFSLHLESQ